MTAVQRCWASVFNRRVTTYQDKQGIKGIPRMAVLVQQLVAAQSAGVAFTANPLTGDRTRNYRQRYTWSGRTAGFRSGDTRRMECKER